MSSTFQLDSMRLWSPDEQVPCFICDALNIPDDEVCRECFAPLDLTFQARQEKTPPRLVAVIGPTAVGKTVYLGMLLDMLSRGFAGLKGIPKGAFSISLQQAVVTSLEQCLFPQKTPNEPDRWHWVHCEIPPSGKKKGGASLVMPDLAGEVLGSELEHPRSSRTILQLLQKASGGMMLIDAPRAREQPASQEFFAMKLVSYLDTLEKGSRTKKVARPIALVLSKADECEECFDDPQGFARSSLPGLWQLCEERLEHFKFFAAGVAGAVGFVEDEAGELQRVPLRIEPRGVLEPFKWLTQMLEC